jgi:hypothetical protein
VPACLPASRLLLQVLMYHVVPAAASAASLTNGQVLPTLLANQTLTVDISGTPPVVQIIPAGGDPATVIQVGGWVGAHGWMVHIGGLGPRTAEW